MRARVGVVGFLVVGLLGGLVGPAAAQEGPGRPAHLRTTIEVPADFDGDGDTDVSVFRPATGRWYTEGVAGSVQFGANGDIPVPDQWDADAATDRAVYRPSNGRWYVEGTAGFASWGVAGDLPVPGHYDADPALDRAVFRPSSGRWYVEGTAGSVQWGTFGDIPVPGQWDADPQTDIAVFRPSTGRWYVHGTPGSAQWGATGDIPVPGQWDADAALDRAVFRPSNGRWYTEGSATSVQFGSIVDVPVAGSYDGAAGHDRAVFRPTTGRWYRTTAAGSTAFGSATDVPLPIPPAVYALFFRPPCSGLTPTIVGTNAGEAITGTAGNDVIHALGGDDQIDGLGGDDVICGGMGDDAVDGGAGTDTVSFADAPGPVEANLASGAHTGEGDDTTAGIENVTGSRFNDTLRGTTGPNVLDGGLGFDGCFASVGVDTGISCEHAAGTVDAASSVDTFRFAGHAGQRIFADAFHTETCNLSWRLLAPNASPVFGPVTLCTNDPGQHTLPATGTYTIEVTGTMAGDYAVRITNVPPAQTFPYTVGTQVEDGAPAPGAGNIEVPGSVDVYTFSGSAGQEVFVDYQEADTCNFRWSLAAPGGANLWADQPICVDRGLVTLPATGTYTLRVETAITDASTGVYRFRITNIPAPQSFAYTVGSTVNDGTPAVGAGNIELPGSVDVYTFTGSAGQKVFVDYQHADTCNLRWTLTGPSSTTVFARTSACADQGPFTLAAAGTYTLRVDTGAAPGQPSDAVGDYAFRITNVPAPQTFAYTVGSTVSDGVPAAGAGRLELPGSVDVYTFTGTAGQKVFLDSVDVSTCNLRWTLTGPSNVTVVARTSACGDPGQLTLPSAGTYRLTVDTGSTPGQPTDAVGPYSFRITNVPGPQTFAYTVGTTVSNGVPSAGAGNLEMPGSVDRYTFSGTAGQVIKLDYLSATTCNLRWQLVAPTSAVVHPDGSICSDSGNLTLPAAGTYTVIVSTLPTSSATGTYSFRVLNV